MRRLNTLVGLITLVAGQACSADDCEAFSPPSAAAARQPRLALTVGHGSEPLTQLKWAPNRQFVATASWDGTVKIWSLNPMAQINTLSGHSDWVRSIDISPNSSAVVSGGNDGSVRVFDVVSGTERLRYSGHGSSRLKDVTAVAFIDERWIASAGFDETLRIIDRDACAMASKLDLGAYVESLIVSHNGQIITGDERGVVRYFAVDQGQLKETGTIETGAALITALAETSDGALLIARQESSDNALPSSSVWLYDDPAKPGRQLVYESLGDIRFVQEDPVKGILHYSDMGFYYQSDMTSGEVMLQTRHGQNLAFPFELDPSSDCTIITVFGGIATYQFADDTVCGQAPSKGEATEFIHLDRHFLLHGASFATIWDLQDGRPLSSIENTEAGISNADFLPGSRVATVSHDGEFGIWSIFGGDPIVRLPAQGDCGLSLARYFRDLETLVTGFDAQFEEECPAHLQIRSAETGQVLTQIASDKPVMGIYRGFETQQFLIRLSLSDWATLQLGEDRIRPFDFRLGGIQDLSVSPDLSRVLVGLDSFYSAKGGQAFILDAGPSPKPLLSLVGHRNSVTAVRYQADGQRILTGGLDGDFRTWTATGSPSSVANQGVGITSMAVNDRFAFTGGTDGGIRVWRLDDQQLLATLHAFGNGNWVVVSPDGRFDTNRFDDELQLNWILPDSPFEPVPLELFLREYYEPRLLARLIAGEKMRPVPLISSLDRRQPTLQIKSVTVTPDHPGRVDVNVAFTRPDGGAVADLMLFRGGQQVGRHPKGGGEIPPESGEEIVFRAIRLPTNSSNSELSFSAYAFNRDGIKSRTATSSFELPKDLERRPRRAFILNIGVDRYQNAGWNLQYAKADAVRLGSVLDSRLKSTGQFSEIITMQLTSPDQTTGEEPTKARISALFKGLRAAEGGTEALPSPDDLLIISYSGHGYADNRGTFHLFPYDIGKGQTRQLNQDLLQRTVTSSELELWLEDVDAGEMVLILDACNSAASVEGTGFKPGPMGSRGLGQLAYNKGMRILAATQAENVAFESETLRHGALTYALAIEGLVALKADFRPADGRIAMGEWLNYGARRVPDLYAEILSGGLKHPQRGVGVVQTQSRPDQSDIDDIQRPALFDFLRRELDTQLVQSR